MWVRSDYAAIAVIVIIIFDKILFLIFAPASPLRSALESMSGRVAEWQSGSGRVGEWESGRVGEWHGFVVYALGMRIK